VSVFKGSNGSYICELPEEITEKVEGVFKVLYSETNDLSLYSARQLERQMIDAIAIAVIDKFVSEFEVLEGERITITVKYKKTVFYINATKYPKTSTLSGMSYNIEY